MKNIYYLFVGLFITTNTWGQPSIKSHSSIEKNGYVEFNLSREDLKSYSWISDIHFFKDEYLYILAYEPLTDNIVMQEKGFRRLFLYRKNLSNIKNPWIVSSDAILTNCIYPMGYIDVILTFKNYNGRTVDGATITENNGEYTITVILYTYENLHVISSYYYTFTLTPVDSYFYKIKNNSEKYKNKYAAYE